MRNKFIKVFAAAMAMAMCLGTTVLAAPSPSAGSFVVSRITGATDSTGKDISSLLVVQEIGESDLPDEYQVLADELKKPEILAQVLANLNVEFDENMTVADVKDVKVLGDITFPAKITFEMKGVTASSKVIILHWLEEEKTWELIDCTVGEGTVTGTFNSLSPVAFVVDKTTLSDDADSTGTKTSPKTGAASTVSVTLLGLAAVTVVCGLKKKSAYR